MRVGYTTRWIPDWFRVWVTHFPRCVHVYRVYARILGDLGMYVHVMHNGESLPQDMSRKGLMRAGRGHVG